jgi:cytoskeletal protein CcmA (bactofilin family)
MLFNKKSDEDQMDSKRSYGSTPIQTPPQPPVQPQGASRKPGNAPTRSVIDSWLVMNGNLQSEGEIQVDGQVNGDIRCQHLTVGESAVINGNIIAEHVVVRGTVKGSIRANVVAIQATAKVDSEIFHKLLSVEQGAVFEGASRRRENPLTAEVKPAADVAGLKAIAAEMKDKAGDGKKVETKAA